MNKIDLQDHQRIPLEECTGRPDCRFDRTVCLVAQGSRRVSSHGEDQPGREEFRLRPLVLTASLGQPQQTPLTGLTSCLTFTR